MKKKNLAKKVGMPSGTFGYTGDKKEDFEITVIDYDVNAYKEVKLKSIEECIPFTDSPTVTWINIVGLHRVEEIEKLEKFYNIHPLVVEDILNINQRPKIEYFEDYIFIVVKMLTYNQENHVVKSEQVSIILGKNFVITIQERKGDIFDPVRDRIRNDKSVIRKNKADYLLYALIDILVDNYFVMLENVGEVLENLEDRVVAYPSPETIRSVHLLKRNLIEMRKSIWPLREILNDLSKGDSKLIDKKTVMYFKDVYDHAIQVIETIETFRDIASEILDIYLSSISNRMNEIMKVLTIIGTIFIPLTFITGIYGMNFKYMPELKWKFGYPLSLSIMLFIGIGMLIYFKKKKWL